MEYVIFIIGVIFGAAVVFIINGLQRKETKKIAQELISGAESGKIQDLEIVINRIKESFGSLSHEALSKNTGEFLKLAGETLSKQTQTGTIELESKKKLIDQTLESIKKEMEKVGVIVGDFEKDRQQKFGALSDQLKSTAKETGKLQETTEHLRSALANTKARGQWGERMAEDVLKLIGFIEGINYQKQKSQETSSTRPDFTFFLPQGLKVNMDVKFPLDNYMRYFEAENETEREEYKNKFLKNVKERIKEVTTKDYINPEENTLNYVIVFIPNDQIYAFINENDSALLDDAIKNKVILCSPITLYAILVVIRQAIDSFNFEKTSSEILSLLNLFNNEWSKYSESFEKMGKNIEKVREEFNKLTSIRRDKLERPLRKIEDLRKININK